MAGDRRPKLNSRRVSRAWALVTVVAAIALASPAAASAAGMRSEVWFLREGSAVSVQRAAPGIPGIVRSLLAGPTRHERSSGLRTSIPSGTALRDVRVERRIVTVDLAARFVAGRDEVSLRTRVGQVVRTVRAIPGVVGVRVRIEGGVPVGLFPGYDLRGVVRDALPDQPVPGLRGVQQALADLGFLATTGVTGSPGDETAVAVLTFQKWTGLPRTGALDDATTSAILQATRPEPVLRRPGKRVEILLGRQVALAIVDDRVERVFHISSGSLGRTPSGSFRVYRKERMSWSVPFSTWMPFASYFVGGIALHAYASVPAYPASHGCVRMTARDAPLMYAFATYGTPVDVIRETIA